MNIRVSDDGRTLYLGSQVLAAVGHREGWTRQAWFVGDGLDQGVKVAVSNAIFSMDGCPSGEALAERIRECFTG